MINGFKSLNKGHSNRHHHGGNSSSSSGVISSLKGKRFRGSYQGTNSTNSPLESINRTATILAKGYFQQVKYASSMKGCKKPISKKLTLLNTCIPNLLEDGGEGEFNYMIVSLLHYMKSHNYSVHYHYFQDSKCLISQGKRFKSLPALICSDSSSRYNYKSSFDPSSETSYDYAIYFTLNSTNFCQQNRVSNGTITVPNLLKTISSSRQSSGTSLSSQPSFFQIEYFKYDHCYEKWSGDYRFVSCEGDRLTSKIYSTNDGSCRGSHAKNTVRMVSEISCKEEGEGNYVNKDPIFQCFQQASEQMRQRNPANLTEEASTSTPTSSLLTSSLFVE